MSTDYGKRLKLARKHAQLTQKQLAPLAGITQSTLSELETIAHGSAFTAQLAAACGVNARWLATGDDQMLDGIGHAVNDQIGRYQVAAPTSIEETVAQLRAQLLRHTATRQKTLADVLSRFACDPGNTELASELTLQLQAPAAGIDKRRSA